MSHQFSDSSRAAPFVETSNMMLASFINDPEHWLQRAEQMRILADEINDEQAKETVLRIANDYGRLVARAEQQKRVRPPNKERPRRA